MDFDSSTAALLMLQEQLDDINRDSQLSPRSRPHLSPLHLPIFEQRKEVVINIQHFWLKALVSHPAFSHLITTPDAVILRELLDVDVTESPANSTNPEDFHLTFTFAANPNFSEEFLRKEYYHTDHGRVITQTPIEWSGKNQPPKYGFFSWLMSDTLDSNHLGSLIKNDVFPRAIELYLGTYS